MPNFSKSENSFNEIRDICDFCTRWEELRDTVQPDAVSDSNLSPEAVEVVHWLRELADKTFKMPIV